MKICFPVESNQGMDSEVYGHFGSAPLFIVFDAAAKTIENINNQDLGHTHGMCSPLKAVGNARPDAVVAGGMGAGAINGLRAAGIKVYLSPASTVEEAAKAVKSGKLKEADPMHACGHHGGPGCH